MKSLVEVIQISVAFTNLDNFRHV